ncbi:hypothetical protein D9758_003613 [Tetrapyrgos nigripes]|uniref:F-box domain-containing protein n=1 Tax=Tetrapyrgos nigripes TaxID=182062 RepID=A0A8H5LRK1_9AGAR|nr:hypothetical protein D9758_003613 [Tetrapyrgos nigripes]
MSAKHFAATFPPEIRDEIIDRVLDTVTTKSCTLVCHDWLPRARTNLFRKFTFPPNARSEYQPEDLSEYKEKLELLAEDMASSSISPPYSRIVRILTVRLPLLISRENLAFNTLISQLPFTNLQSLDFSSRNLDSTSLLHLLEKNPLLESLALSSFTCSSNHLLRLLSRIAAGRSSLQSLTLGVIPTCPPDLTNTWDSPFDASSTPLSLHPPRLQSLSFSTLSRPTCNLVNPKTWVLPFFTIPEHFFDLSSLCYLTLKSHVPRRYPIILQQCGPTVTHFTLTSFNRNFFGPSLAPSFRHLTKLVDLTLTEIFESKFSDTVAILKSILSVVIQRLEHLSLEFRTLYHWPSLDAESFGNNCLCEIDNLLDGFLQTGQIVHATSLKKLSLKIPTHYNMDETEIRAYFSATNANGRLSLEVSLY